MSKTPLNEVKLFTTGQISKVLGVSLSTVQKWLDAGIIESFKLPVSESDRRVSRDKLLAFMEKYNLPTDEIEEPCTQE